MKGSCFGNTLPQAQHPFPQVTPPISELWRRIASGPLTRSSTQESGAKGLSDPLSAVCRKWIASSYRLLAKPRPRKQKSVIPPALRRKPKGPGRPAFSCTRPFSIEQRRVPGRAVEGPWHDCSSRKSMRARHTSALQSALSPLPIDFQVRHAFYGPSHSA